VQGDIVLAEGIETQEELNTLRKLGVDKAQGCPNLCEI
jgi:EAL domain-containing protein (putative c-di-GMP-specific phosphodiesterase class I)